MDVILIDKNRHIYKCKGMSNVRGCVLTMPRYAVPAGYQGYYCLVCKRLVPSKNLTSDWQCVCGSFAKETYVAPTTGSIDVSKSDCVDSEWYYNETNKYVPCLKCGTPLTCFGGTIEREWLELFMTRSNFAQTNFDQIVKNLIAEQIELEKMATLPPSFPNFEQVSDMLAKYTSISNKVRMLQEFVSVASSTECIELTMLSEKDHRIQTQLDKLHRYAKMVKLLNNEKIERALEMIGEQGFVEKLEALLENLVIVAENK
jgi:hypothetical protein